MLEHQLNEIVNGGRLMLSLYHSESNIMLVVWQVMGLIWVQNSGCVAVWLGQVYGGHKNVVSARVQAE